MLPSNLHHKVDSKSAGTPARIVTGSPLAWAADCPSKRVQTLRRCSCRFATFHFEGRRGGQGCNLQAHAPAIHDPTPRSVPLRQAACGPDIELAGNVMFLTIMRQTPPRNNDRFLTSNAERCVHAVRPHTELKSRCMMHFLTTYFEWAMLSHVHHRACLVHDATSILHHSSSENGRTKVPGDVGPPDSRRMTTPEARNGLIQKSPWSWILFPASGLRIQLPLIDKVVSVLELTIGQEQQPTWPDDTWTGCQGAGEPPASTIQRLNCMQPYGYKAINSAETTARSASYPQDSNRRGDG